MAEARMAASGTQSEVEARFLGVDPAQVRERVARAHGSLVSATFLREVLFLRPGEDRHTLSGYVRVRDDGHNVVMTHKRRSTEQSGPVEARDEVEVGVHDFDAAAAVLEAAGLRRLEYREKHRTTYRLGAATVTVDRYPGLPPLMEVEATTHDAMRAACDALNLSLADHFPGGVLGAYRHFGIPRDPSAPLRLSEAERRELLEAAVAPPT